MKKAGLPHPNEEEFKSVDSNGDGIVSEAEWKKVQAQFN